MEIQIPNFYINMKEEDLEELRSDIWNDLPLPANLIIDKSIYDIDISYRGSYTRPFRKRSYFIEFIEPDMFNGGREIHLNAEYRDPSLFRNKLSLDFFYDLGVLSPKSYHVNLIRNDVPKGVYLVLESVDDLFLTNRDLPIGPIYYAVNNNANFSYTRDGRKKRSRISGYRQKIGNKEDDEALRKLIDIINTTSDMEFSKTIPGFVNINKYIHWMIGAVCTMNNDGFTHNYALYQNTHTGLYEVIPWDYDATWGRKVDGGIMNCDYVPIQGKKGNYLCYRILQVQEFRKQYKERLEEVLETKFTVDYMENKITALHQQLLPHVMNDPYKKRKIDKFKNEPEIICQFILDRSNYLKQHFSELD
ncbi:inner spore coat protein H [Ornithinibacillus bavariensis]|uniref:Inner spore coat protein H n=2 Tax=Ornithinibacillus bavariensis TaxID=545502 RepID=A0A919XCE0_9BACI|nr:inner spore coat protein H [Ornithinibacillus bavariensis]